MRERTISLISFPFSSETHKSLFIQLNQIVPQIPQTKTKIIIKQHANLNRQTKSPTLKPSFCPKPSFIWTWNDFFTENAIKTVFDISKESYCEATGSECICWVIIGGCRDFKCYEPFGEPVSFQFFYEPNQVHLISNFKMGAMVCPWRRRNQQKPFNLSICQNNICMIWANVCPHKSSICPPPPF